MLTIVCRVLGLPSPTALAFYALTFFLACSVAFTTGWTVNGWRYDSKLAAQKLEARDILLAKTEEAMANARALQIKINELEVEHAKQTEEINRLASKNNGLAAKLDGVLSQLQPKPGRWDGSRCTGPEGAAVGRYIDHLHETITKLSGAVGSLGRAGNELARDADREAEVAGTGVAYALELAKSCWK